MQRPILRRAASLLSTLALSVGFLVAMGTPAQANEGPDWLPFKEGDGVVKVGCTWNNGCDGGYHNGSLAPAIDFIASTGTHVYAAGPGTLTGHGGCDPLNSPGCNGWAGNYVTISHPDGRTSRYLHLSTIEKANGSVNRGDLIGKVGNSGGSPVPHLHYDEMLGGVKVDPGDMKAVHGSSLVTYPRVLHPDYTTWNKVPDWEKWVWSDSFTEPVTTPPDDDGDGVPNASDACPNIPGQSPNGCLVKGDHNRDGRADVTAFYRHDNNLVNMRVWYGQSSGYVTEPTGPWTGTGWDGSRIIPAGRDDFNGDGKNDVAAFFRHDGGMLDLNIWYGNGHGDFNQVRAWHVPSGWDGSRLIPAGSGDINRDGRADIVAFFRHDNNLVDLRVWYGQGNGYTTEPTGPWSGAGWDGNRVIPAGIGDMDGDGKLDVSTFYRHDGGMVDHNVWYGNGVGDFTLARPWHVASGWDGSRLIPAGVADFNADGRADSAMYFRHDNNLVDLRIWFGTSNRVMSEPGGPWSGTGWDGNRILSAGAGDYNGDGRADLASFYRHDNGMLDLNIWSGNGNGGMSQFRSWHVPNAWEGERVIPVRD